MARKTALPNKPKRGAEYSAKAHGAIYCRYSSHNQKEASISQQIEWCQKLAEEYKIDIIKVYSDEAVTGRTDKRKSFQLMMKDAAAGKFSYLISWKSNRIGRNMLEAMMNEERLREAGVRILYVEEDFEDNAAGRFAARSMMNVNQFYSESMAEDVRRGMIDNAKKCMVTNGHLPLGYKKDENLHYVIDEPRAAVVREIFTRVAAGDPFMEIFDDLNSRGITTSYGKPWGRTSLNKIISNERYRGIYIYDDVRIENGIPRIVSDELYFKVQEVLKVKNNPRGRRRNTADYLLTGKLFCGHCGSPMTGYSGHSRNGTLHHYYVCQKRRVEKTCEKKNVRQEEIETLIAQKIVNDVLGDDAVIEFIADSTVAYNKKCRDQGHIGILEERLANAEKAAKNIMSAIEQGIITETTKKRLLELEAEQATIRADIEAAKAEIVDVSREVIIAGLQMFRDGDVNSPAFRQKLFDTFLLAAYLFDDKLSLMFRFSGNKNKVDIPLDASAIEKIENSADAECSFKLHLAPPRCEQTNTEAIIQMVGGVFVFHYSLQPIEK